MHRPHVLVLGAGLAGLGAAEKLKKAAVDVTLIDKNKYHTFQPLLYQVATNLLDVDVVGTPIRNAINKQDNLTFQQTAVTHIDLKNRTVACADLEPLSYDYLVLALGAKVNYFGVKGAIDHAFPLYMLVDAAHLKEHILTRGEVAWLSWDTVHLALLGGSGNRNTDLAKNGFILFSGRRASRIIGDEDSD